MAKRSVYGISQKKLKSKPKRTSIGKSINSRPKNKHKKKSWKNIEGKEVNNKEKSMWIIKYCGS